MSDTVQSPRPEQLPSSPIVSAAMTPSTNSGRTILASLLCIANPPSGPLEKEPPARREHWGATLFRVQNLTVTDERAHPLVLVSQATVNAATTASSAKGRMVLASFLCMMTPP